MEASKADGGVLLVVLIVLGCALLFWFAIIVILSMIRSKKKGGREGKAPHAPGPVPVHAQAHPHSAASGAGNHDHAHSPSHTGKGFPLIDIVCTIVTVLCVLGTVWLWSHMGPSHTKTVTVVETRHRTTEIRTTTGSSARVIPSDAPLCPTKPIKTYTITSPPKGEGWSVQVDVPKCHRIRFCDRTQDPECTATDFDQSRFVAKCTSPGDSTVREFARARDNHSDACWIQSKGAEALQIDVIAEFDPST